VKVEPMDSLDQANLKLLDRPDLGITFTKVGMRTAKNGMRTAKILKYLYRQVHTIFEPVISTKQGKMHSLFF
jgi:hypothetical protein